MSANTKNRRYAAITADVVGSRSFPDFRGDMSAKLQRVSSAHLKQKLILHPYTVTTWDEFQTLLADLARLPHIIFDLRRLLRPFDLRVGVGIGQAEIVAKKPINEWGGSAFERARRALENLKDRKGQKFPRLTEIRSERQNFDRLAQLVYDLHDTLAQKVTDHQWQTINALIETTSQEKAAKKMRLHESTVTRNLQRGFYWQMRETIDVMAIIIKEHFEHQ